MKLRKNFLIILILTLCLLLSVGTALAKPVTITFWHAMSGSRLGVLESIIESFNAAHPDLEVKPLFTGSYAETLTKYVTAYPTGTAPNIVQVYEVGTQTMIDSDAIIPVYKIPEMLGETWDWAQYVIPITHYYSVDGKLWSMPFNSSTAMLYYNKDIFKAAGLDPNKPPTTWKEMEEYGEKILASGVVDHVYSGGWPDWIFEQTLAYNDHLYADNDNGRTGLAKKVVFNDDFGYMVFDTWVRLHKKGIYIYGGVEYEANSAFNAGQIAMLIQSTSSLAGIIKASKFKVGTSFLPRFEGYPVGNSVIGGGSLWITKGQSDEELRGVWEFLKYLSREDIAIKWHKGTGYFPASSGALKTLLDEGWFSADQTYLTAFLQILAGRRDTAASTGVRLGPFVAMRDLFRAALEKAIAGELSPKDALDKAAEKMNALLKDYAELYGK
ncbi:MAG: ABC transporter substrate-binding protein [Candidatus Infernicultor aquiphilus]|uniref:sn-glycerol-3-phosphate-binding periplasmic protein UgpB n=1 Tax=Candidatus Infernicultor aquiphilus TaxID=1805029 RepID=A0A1J5GJ42_9BACT|nr:MAG: ABC transporter substrate-binding protein [Candidatus Atribacteria bacterium CG2_30_33_13]PJB56887.1 MAG: ABC transporter substrate-binding protein [Candidatus Atribacteria bacterium CG_4_9_14_3_um_filter_33_16]